MEGEVEGKICLLIRLGTLAEGQRGFGGEYRSTGRRLKSEGGGGGSPRLKSTVEMEVMKRG